MALETRIWDLENHAKILSLSMLEAPKYFAATRCLDESSLTILPKF
jgi:hypothetical protein